MVSSTPRPLFTPGEDPVTIVQEARWAPGPVWASAENLAPTGILSPDRPAHSQSLYRLSYRAHHCKRVSSKTVVCFSSCSACIEYHTTPAKPKRNTNTHRTRYVLAHIHNIRMYSGNIVIKLTAHTENSITIRHHSKQYLQKHAF